MNQIINGKGLFASIKGQWRVQAIWDNGILDWAPLPHFPPNKNKKISSSSIEAAIIDFTMHLTISKWLRRQKTKMLTDEENNKINWGGSKKRNCQQKCFHSSKYVIGPADVRFFFLNSLWTCSHSLNDTNSLECFVQFFLYYLLHLFSSDRLAALTSLWPYKFFIWIYEFFKSHPQRRVFCNAGIELRFTDWLFC